MGSSYWKVKAVPMALALPAVLLYTFCTITWADLTCNWPLAPRLDGADSLPDSGGTIVEPRSGRPIACLTVSS